MNKRDLYRMDGRTKEQFIEDIKRGNKREQRAVKLFGDFLFWEHGFIQPIVENGVDMSGDFIEDVNQVDASADYLVGDLPMEVKTCPNHTSVIYLKVDQVNSYIKQGASLLFVNGIDRKEPAFTLFTVEDLKKFEELYYAENPPRGINGGKRSYKMFTRDIQFLTFDGKVKTYE